MNFVTTPIKSLSVQKVIYLSRFKWRKEQPFYLNNKFIVVMLNLPLNQKRKDRFIHESTYKYHIYIYSNIRMFVYVCSVFTLVAIDKIFLEKVKGKMWFGSDKNFEVERNYLFPDLSGSVAERGVGVGLKVSGATGWGGVL